MDISKISSANKNDKVILSDKRECIIKQKLEKHTLENGNIIWKIFMKDDKYFIIDDISLNDVLLHPNIWFISNSKYIVSRNEGKTINLNQLLLPKNNEKELYIHRDGDNFNFRISNILLATQSVVNSKKTNIFSSICWVLRMACRAKTWAHKKPSPKKCNGMTKRLKASSTCW
jgi:hypothetical protein